MKKIYLSAKGPMDCSAWAELWDETKVRKHLSEQLKEAGLVGRAFKTIRVEEYDEDNEHVYIWGEDSPGEDVFECGEHKGLRVLINGEEVFNNLKILDPETHDDGCEVCHEEAE